MKPDTLTTGAGPDLEPRLVEVAIDAYAYVQPDGTWWINNAGFVVGSDGVILIDTCSTEQRTLALLAAVRTVTEAPIRLVVNTHHHGDHTHGNYLTKPATIVAHARCRDEVSRAGIQHYEQIFEQPDWGALQPSAPNVTFESRLDLWADHVLVELHHPNGPAHTTNDVVAWLPAQRVLYTGDLVFNGGTPFVLMGSITGSLRALDVLRAFDAAIVVPGHGDVCGPEVFDTIERYLVMIEAVAARALDAGDTPLDAARATDLGEFAGLSDCERLVGNLHRSMAEQSGRTVDEPRLLRAAIADMVTFRGGALLPCSA
jgi:cyclase